MDPLLIAEQLRAPQPAKPSNTQMIVDTLRSMAGAATDKEFWKDIGKGLFNQELPKPANTYAEMQQMWRDDPSRRLNQVMGVAGFAPMAATVFHGSPHNFSKFDASKIGTGEGAQAYGHGLYFAENPAVAAEYMRAGRNVGFLNWDDVGLLGQKAFAQAKGNKDGALKVLDELAASTSGKTMKNNALLAKQAIQRGDIKAGIYKVDLPDSAISKMLDWDKPLSQQSAEVQKAVQKAVDLKATQTGNRHNLKPDTRVEELHGVLGYDRLFQAGIPGIRYLDQGSRATGKGTYNYVVFPGGEDMLKILGRE